MIFEKAPTLDKSKIIRITASMIIAIAGFGYTGILWGEAIHPLGDSIIFLPFNFWIIVGIWGIILGVLTLEWKTTVALPVLGLIAGVVSIIVGNLGGLIFLAIVFGWFQIASYVALPLIFLYFGFLFFKEGKKVHTTAFFILFISGVIDWVLMIITFSMQDNYQKFQIIFHAPLFGNALFFAIIGLIIGTMFGYGVKKIETMALFGVIGFTLGSFWMSIFANSNLYMTSANEILIYTFMAATVGAALVTGLFWPGLEAGMQEINPAQGNVSDERGDVEIT